MKNIFRLFWSFCYAMRLHLYSNSFPVLIVSKKKCRRRGNPIFVGWRDWIGIIAQVAYVLRKGISWKLKFLGENKGSRTIYTLVGITFILMKTRNNVSAAYPRAMSLVILVAVRSLYSCRPVVFVPLAVLRARSLTITWCLYFMRPSFAGLRSWWRKILSCVILL